MMRMLCRTLPCCLLCILLLISGPMTTTPHAQSGATVERTSFTISDEFTATDPCAGVPVVITEIRRVHIIDVFDASGGEHVNFVEVVTATAVDAAGNTYVAGQTVIGAGTATVDNGVEVITALTDLHLISTGGGDNFIGHVMERFTITPNGTHGEVTFVSSECVG